MDIKPFRHSSRWISRGNKLKSYGNEINIVITKHTYLSIFRASVIAAIATSFAATVLVSSNASAVTGADWKAGRIMDDEIMRSPKTMSVQEIQRFLNSKVPVCDTWGTQPYAGTTRAQYAASHG